MVFKWNGQYVGFIHNGNLPDLNSRYLGWMEEDGQVWNANGSYLGQVIEGSYILRNATMFPPMPRMPPLPPLPPLPPMRRMPRMPLMGWVDALEGE
jgi:hypothetical protein